MMKKICALALVMMLLIPSALASSLFSLPTTPETEAAPSYGVMADVAPDGTQTLKDGAQVQIYQDVSDNDYLDFGTLLADRGYGVAQQNKSGNVISVVVTKGSISFQVDYDQKTAKLTVSYPAGVEIEEKDYFEDYIEVAYGESFKFSGLAKITPKSFGSNKFIGGSYPTFTADIQNLSTKTLYGNDFTVSLHIVNEDNHYTYQVKDIGVKYVLSTGSLTLRGAAMNPLETETLTYSFNLSASSLNSTDGTVAITFEGKNNNNEKYVIYVRDGN